MGPSRNPPPKKPPKWEFWNAMSFVSWEQLPRWWEIEFWDGFWGWGVKSAGHCWLGLCENRSVLSVMRGKLLRIFFNCRHCSWDQCSSEAAFQKSLKRFTFWSAFFETFQKRVSNVSALTNPSWNVWNVWNALQNVWNAASLEHCWDRGTWLWWVFSLTEIPYSQHCRGSSDKETFKGPRGERKNSKVL